MPRRLWLRRTLIVFLMVFVWWMSAVVGHHGGWLPFLIVIGCGAVIIWHLPDVWHRDDR